MKKMEISWDGLYDIDGEREEVEETKEFQIKKWKEAKNQNRKKFKLVQHKLSGFFSDFPNPEGDK